MAHVLAHPSQPDGCGCKIHAFYIWAGDLEQIGARLSLPVSFLRITKGVPRFSVCGKTSAWQSGSWGKVRFYLFYRGAWDAFDWLKTSFSTWRFASGLNFPVAQAEWTISCLCIMQAWRVPKALWIFKGHTDVPEEVMWLLYVSGLSSAWKCTLYSNYVSSTFPSHTVGLKKCTSWRITVWQIST